MKKYIVPAGILCTAAVAGTIAYQYLKKHPKGGDDIVFYPMGRYVIHTKEEHSTLEALVKEADLVIQARIVGKSSPRWNNRENRQPKTVSAKDFVYFDYLVTPVITYKGLSSKSIDLYLRSTEGSIGGYILEDNSQPKLEEGQEVILLLKHGSQKQYKHDSRAYYTLCGSLDGVLRINGEMLDGQSCSYHKSVFETIVNACVNP